MKKLILASLVSVLLIFLLSGCAPSKIETNFDCEDVLSEGMVNIDGVIYNSNWQPIAEANGKIGSYSEGMASVNISSLGNNNTGYIDTEGNEVIKPKNSVMGMDFHEGLTLIERFGKWGCIDKKGNIIVKPEYDYANPYEGGIARFGNYDETFYIDKAGNVILNGVPGCDDIFRDGLASFSKDSKWGFINIAGDEVILPQFEFVFSFSEGLAAVEKDGKWGFINTLGEVVIDFQYDSGNLFSEGLARVKKEEKYGFINKSGDLVIDYQFKEASDFENGFAIVSNASDQEGIIDKSGKTIIEPQYYYIDLKIADKGYLIVREEDSLMDGPDKIVRIDNNEILDIEVQRDNVKRVSLSK